MATKLLYPQDWSIIAFRAKEKANWTCAECDRHPPDYPAKNISVHHLDHNTFNNDESNLLVLCAEHHFVYERKHRFHLKRERFLNHLQATGQAFLPGINPFPTI